MAVRRNGVVLLTALIFLPFFWFMLSSRPAPEDADLEQRLTELRERLRFAELQNQARSKELQALREEIKAALTEQQQNSHRPEGNNNAGAGKTGKQLSEETKRKLRSLVGGGDLQLPSIYNYMPHLREKPDALQPAFHLGQGRTGVSFVLGIPTIKREKESYLMQSLASILDGLSDEEKDDCVIVLFIGETEQDYVHRIAEMVKESYKAPIESGLLEIISPPAGFYPDLDSLKETFGDPKERVKWRTKQNLDFSFLMMYCQPKGQFYVQLEDDVIGKPGYISTMKNFALQQKTEEWMILEFSQLGFIGKLFKSSDLSLVVEFFLMFHKDKPIDWLLDHIFFVKACHPEKDNKHCDRMKSALRVRFKPSLFQHIGTFSSLKGKIQKLKDKDFGKQPLHRAHTNPPADVSTTLEVYQKYTLEKCYLGENFFWGLTPTKGDTIVFSFHSPIVIEKYKFSSGNTEHPGDKLINTTVDVLPENHEQKEGGILQDNKEDNTKTGMIRLDDGFIQIGQFNAAGVAEGEPDKSIGRVRQLRLRCLSDGKAWVILSEIHIKPDGTR
ncbi:PREDICTED: alpha-1,3-mannosyl-glycoprotein 4-beta-N-acetylglucosaminyltransferase B-like isoform X2 [Branchiostoma belcheri]|uniref:Alpha-1,3-mannosyl-glycoprotein 4-beta-N-acetylglucosaminyltransferase B-like isoform X2 n=1 Tax=Branchiostoma belcheri TaxID=7741 RepID=A0A6P4YIP5_BRABE|nr:PREDICTED: alpha-1,3-mannosyl-glycoprotein 4-beta-N-acetylglucosaminyltransferase B-like isoform X2 [Branchiostoma belcheri]